MSINPNCKNRIKPKLLREQIENLKKEKNNLINQ